MVMISSFSHAVEISTLEKAVNVKKSFLALHNWTSVKEMHSYFNSSKAFDISSTSPDDPDAERIKEFQEFGIKIIALMDEIELVLAEKDNAANTFLKNELYSDPIFYELNLLIFGPPPGIPN